MSYISGYEGSIDSGFGCGPECKCGPCGSRVSGVDEWYEKEEVDKPPRVRSPANLSPKQPLHGFAEPRGPLPQPVIPGPPAVLMPTNPLVPKPWCSELKKVQNSFCYPYGPQEIAVSKTEAGHLTPDVVLVQSPAVPQNHFLSCQYLIIRDFGVDWRHLKRSAIKEQLFKDWLNRFETNKSLTFRIVGYSDCIGVERNNLFLRNGRARNVLQLLGPSARSRVLAVSAAPPGTYLTDNSTAAARANTRAAVIEIFFNSSQAT